MYSRNESRSRLACYVIIALFTTISSEIQHSNWYSYTWQQAVVSVCTILVSVATAWRAYIDKTDSQVDDTKK